MDLQIEPNYIISQISWTKTGDYLLNYLLGVFEASNDRSFSTGIPIAIIKEEGKFNEVNFIDINTPNTYKYVRYVPPNKNKTKMILIRKKAKPRIRRLQVATRRWRRCASI